MKVYLREIGSEDRTWLALMLANFTNRISQYDIILCFLFSSQCV
jgi:hypothetical protein